MDTNVIAVFCGCHHCDDEPRDEWMEFGPDDDWEEY